MHTYMYCIVSYHVGAADLLRGVYTP